MTRQLLWTQSWQVTSTYPLAVNCWSIVLASKQINRLDLMTSSVESSTLTATAFVSFLNHGKKLAAHQPNKKQAQLRLCKLGLGTVFLIKFFSEIKKLSVALLSQASLVVGCMLTSTYNFQAKSHLPTWSRSTLIWVLKNRNALTN